MQLLLQPKLFWSLTCLKAELVSGPDMSWGRTCPSTLGPELSQGWTCLGAGLALGLDLSHGRTCFGAGLVLGPDLSKNFGLGVSKSFRAGIVSRPDLVHGRKCLGAEFFNAPSQKISTHCVLNRLITK